MPFTNTTYPPETITPADLVELRQNTVGSPSRAVIGHINHKLTQLAMTPGAEMRTEYVKQSGNAHEKDYSHWGPSDERAIGLTQDQAKAVVKDFADRGFTAKTYQLSNRQWLIDVRA